MAVLGTDPTAVEPQAIAGIPVQMTILGGAPVYARRQRLGDS